MKQIDRRNWGWIILIGIAAALLYCAVAISAGIFSAGPWYWGACETYFHVALCVVAGAIAGIGIKLDYLRLRHLPIFILILVAIKFFSLIVASDTPLNFSTGHWTIEGIIFVFFVFLAFWNTPPCMNE